MSSREASVLAGARRGLAPTAGDAKRVRLAVDAAILAAGGATASSTPPSNTASPSGLVEKTLLRWARLGATFALAAATGVGGYALGYRAGSATITKVTPAVVNTQVPTGSKPVEVSVPVMVTELPSPLADPRPGVGTTPQATTSTAAATDATGESPLERETRLLTRVERALRDDNPRLALGLLGELDRDVPGGQLAEERQAARVLAYCTLGTESAPKRANDFITGHPSSAYRDRIRTACALIGTKGAKE